MTNTRGWAVVTGASSGIGRAFALEHAWSNTGRHTESGTYSVERWMGYYAERLVVHARQIARNVATFGADEGGVRR